MKNILVAQIICALILIASCKDDESTLDNTKPIVQSIELVNSPNSEVQAGDTLIAKYSIEDDLDLSEVAFEVHTNFDGHSHLKANLRWSTSSIVPLIGQSGNGEARLPVPENAASGPYHLEVIALDKSGNRSDVYVVPFDLVQSGQPEVEVILLPESLQPGESFSFELFIKDDLDLKNIRVEITNDALEDSGQEPLWSTEIELTGSDDKEYNISEEIEMKSSKSGEEYHLQIIVADQDDNHLLREYHVQIE